MCRRRWAGRPNIGATTCAATTAPRPARFRSCAGADPLALIALSSAVPTGPFMATGELGDQQLSRLAQALDQTSGHVPRRAHSSPAGEPAQPLFAAADRRRGISPGPCRARRRPRSSRPRSLPRALCGSTARAKPFPPSACRPPRRASPTATRMPPAITSSASRRTATAGAAR